MNTKRLFFLACFLSIPLSIQVAFADGRRAGAASHPAFVRSAPRVVPGLRGSPATFQRWNGNWAGSRRFVSPYRSTANWRGWNGRTAASLARSNNWNWRRHNHDRFVFVGGFGFPWYYPYGYSPYDYYPYGYDPYGYSYYGGSAYYPDGSSGYNSGYDDSVRYYGDSKEDRSGRSNRSVVAQVQERLAQDGYYKGPIDGLTGSRTYYAIRAYQRDHKLRADGAINDQLLAEMRLR